MNRLKIISLITCLVWNASLYAEDKENRFSKYSTPELNENTFSEDDESSYLPELNENTFSEDNASSTRFDGNGFYGDIPPVSKEILARQGRPRSSIKAITKYSSNIKPGDKLPAKVYECVLKNLHGIGSDVAAKLIWTACLRLYLK